LFPWLSVFVVLEKGVAQCDDLQPYGVGGGSDLPRQNPIMRSYKASDFHPGSAFFAAKSVSSSARSL
jgi:hypothetical protein